MSINNVIRSGRMMKGLTLKELSELTGISSSYLSTLENSKSKTPSMSRLKIICSVLDIDMNNLELSNCDSKVNEVGKKIRNLRKLNKLTLSELSDKVGVSVHIIRKYELGYREVPTDFLSKVVDIFNVDLSYFYSDDTGNNSQLPNKNNVVNEVISNKVDLGGVSNFNSTISKIRKSNNLTHTELASILNVSEIYLRRCELGITTPNTQLVKSVVEKFEISPMEMFSWFISEKIKMENYLNNYLERVSLLIDKTSSELLEGDNTDYSSIIYNRGYLDGLKNALKLFEYSNENNEDLCG